MSVLGLGLTGGGLALGGHYINRDALTRTSPQKDSAIHKEAAMLNALDSYVKRVSPDNPITDLNIDYPTSEEIEAARKPRGNLREVASSGRKDGVPGVKINPNAPAPLLAHELGHTAFGQTKVGNAVQSARAELSSNPKMRAALIAAGSLSPFIASALTPGDDDLLPAVGLSLALESPAIIDEFEANRRSLALMKDAGVPMRIADRARMAGSFLSYLGKPLALAASGNIAGNMLDSDV